MTTIEKRDRQDVGEGGHEFLFVAPPLPITGAAGSPVNPLGIF